MDIDWIGLLPIVIIVVLYQIMKEYITNDSSDQESQKRVDVSEQASRPRRNSKSQNPKGQVNSSSARQNRKSKNDRSSTLVEEREERPRANITKYL